MEEECKKFDSNEEEQKRAEKGKREDRKQKKERKRRRQRREKIPLKKRKNRRRGKAGAFFAKTHTKTRILHQLHILYKVCRCFRRRREKEHHVFFALSVRVWSHGGGFHDVSL